MYLLGFDIGSSSIKAALLDGDNNKTVAVVTSPSDHELTMSAPQQGWAEQNPDTWWDHICIATKSLLEKTKISPSDIKAIGIAYQMHGLVMVDKHHQAIRPSIIWCDSRAVSIGEETFERLGSSYCLGHLLNSPGNFTASKLRWVLEKEPELFAKTSQFMLPGDYLAMKMTGEIKSTISGLSEGTLWDFKENKVADQLLAHLGISESLVPNLTPTFGFQGALTGDAAKLMGLTEGIAITYRAGDQPNNALSLGVIEDGEVAATGGTSGVVYGVKNQPIADKAARINSFAHVNYTHKTPMTGALLCINAAGILYRWVRLLIGEKLSYSEMEVMAAKATVGSDGAVVLPFGNGAERMLGNRDLGASIEGLQLNRHTKNDIIRASLEGIAFSFIYGMQVLEELGIPIQKMRVGSDNLFQSKIFSSTISNLMGTQIELVANTGAVGAARGAGFGLGHFSSLKEAVSSDKVIKSYTPSSTLGYGEAYEKWKNTLNKKINNHDESK